ncbi:hypothetical protein [Mycolicibacterium pallens]|uniref:hypothetical protein n=1 Tax=Mycolicibacterium pallens TaxID=370524 RepID=UPI0031CEB295
MSARTRRYAVDDLSIDDVDKIDRLLRRIVQWAPRRARAERTEPVLRPLVALGSGRRRPCGDQKSFGRPIDGRPIGGNPIGGGGGNAGNPIGGGGGNAGNPIGGGGGNAGNPIGGGGGNAGNPIGGGGGNAGNPIGGGGGNAGNPIGGGGGNAGNPIGGGGGNAGRLSAGNAAAENATGAADDDGLRAFWMSEYVTAETAEPATAVAPPIAPLATGTPMAVAMLAWVFS